MEYKYSCPACQKIYKVTENHFGKSARCVNCNLTFQIPKADYFIERSKSENQYSVLNKDSADTTIQGKITFYCHNCGKQYVANSIHIGKAAACVNCKTILTVPNTDYNESNRTSRPHNSEKIHQTLISDNSESEHHQKQTTQEIKEYVVTGARKVSAFLAFNAYLLIFMLAFQENTPYLFDGKLLQEAIVGNSKIDPRELGWGNHFIYALFAGIVATALSGILSGAIVKKNGGKIAVIANIPNILVWCAIIYFLGFTDFQTDANTGFIIISAIAIPLLTFIAYYFGEFGQDLQHRNFEDHTVLGIKAYHWGWIFIPLYEYSLGLIFVGVNYARYLIMAPSDQNFIQLFISLLWLIPVIVWIYPLKVVYSVLKGEHLTKFTAAMRALANLGTLILGTLMASGVQLACYKLVNYLAK